MRLDRFQDAIPIKAQELRGKEVDICMHVDSDHAGDRNHADQDVVS